MNVRNISIRVKIVVAVLVVCVVGLVNVLGYLQWSYDGQVASASKETVVDAQTAFEQLENADIDKLGSALDSLRMDDSIRNVFLTRDRDALYDETQPTFEELKRRHSITHWYFEELESAGSVFLRVHKPEQFGDKLTRVTYRQAVARRDVAAGLELGKSGVALRVVAPYLSADGKKVIGYMELGQEIDSFLGEVKKNTGHDVGLLLLKSKMDHKTWADAAKAKGEKDIWNERADYVLVGTSSTGFEREMDFEGKPSELPEDGKVLGTFDEDEGKVESRSVFPLRDAAGEAIGVVFVEGDLTEQVSRLAATRTAVMTSVAIMVALVAALIVLMLNLLVFRRLDAMIASMEEVSVRIAGGDFDARFEAGDAKDEIGDFERFFARFVDTVTGALRMLAGRKAG